MILLILRSEYLVLKDELEMNMRLIGARTLDDLDESLVDTRALSTHIGILNLIENVDNSPCAQRHPGARCL